MSQVGLILGSNFSAKYSFLDQAIRFIKIKLNSDLICSSIYQSPSWGYESEHDYVNQVVVLDTDLAPDEVLKEVLNIETIMGRERKGTTYIDRCIDIDVLFYDDLIVATKTLELPHPRLHLRNFCLQPLFELLPDWKHPKMNKSIVDLIADCPDLSPISISNDPV